MRSSGAYGAGFGTDFLGSFNARTIGDLKSIALENPCGVLHLEDDDDILRMIQDLYENEPVTYFAVRTVAEATRVLVEEKDIIRFVIVDIDLGDGEETGEDWVYNNQLLLQEKEMYIVAGDLSLAADPERLQEIARGVVIKGGAEAGRVMNVPLMYAFAYAAKRTYRELEDAMGEVSSPKELVGQTSPAGQGARDLLLESLIEDFRGFIDQFRNKDAKLWHSSGKSLSPAEILEEVEAGTDLGNQFVRLFYEDLKGAG